MNKDLFSTLGVKIKKQAIPNQLCDLIKQEMFTSIESNDAIFKNFHLRKTYKHQLSTSIFDEIYKLTKSIKPELENFFKEELKYSKPIQALVYDKGHFFKPHRDDTKSDDRKIYRKITVVFFLSKQGQQHNEGEYGGGNLNLYGVFKKFPNKAFSIPNEKGTMVAFRANEIHEVTQVEWGRRCSLVVWFE